MTLAAEQPKAEKNLFWLFEVELRYRIEGKSWTQDDAPNTACWWMAHSTEGEPSRVLQLLRSTGVITTLTERATLVLCQANASSWFYDTATGYLHVHMSGGDAPDTASKYYLKSYFWKAFPTHQYEMPNTVYDANGAYVEARLGQMATGVTQEVNDFDEVGIRQTWDSIRIANADGKYDAALVTYIWHLCKCILKIGAPGDAYANLVTINRGRTGSIDWDDQEISIDIEDPLLAEE
jgi:hypothetical protein